MQFKIIADENVNFHIVTTLKNKTFDIISVLREYQGISDEEIIGLAKRFNALLLTEVFKGKVVNKTQFLVVVLNAQRIAIL